jgi:hypothetical protein
VSAGGGPVLTLEPLVEGVRGGVEANGWALSGLQKTTSHEFAGRWEGESTRSAYLFFHRPRGHEQVSIEAFLDETARGIQGNLSLVLDGPALQELGDAREALATAGAAARRGLGRTHRASVSLKLRLEDLGASVDGAGTELRIKVRVPQSALRAGVAGVSDLSARVVRGFERLLEDPDLARFGASR